MSALLHLLVRSSNETSSEEDECAALKGPNFDPNSDEYAAVMIAWCVTIGLAVLASAASFWLCFRHFQHYHNPVHQRQIVRILLMVPVYAFCSTLSFRLIQYTVYIDIVRDCYEAFVLYSFYILLTNYLGPTLEAQHERMQGKPKMRYPAPLCCLWYNPSGYAFLLNTKFLVLQYVVVRPATTTLAMILSAFNLLCPTSSSPSHGQFWITYINLISSTLAMYGLFTFYIVVHNDIKEYKPLWKVIAVKFIVFFTFWQSILLDALVAMQVIKSSTTYSSENATDLIQSFLICTEMVIAALLHMKAFPYSEFTQTTAGRRTRVLPSMLDALSPMHILHDITSAPGDVRAQRKRRKQKKRNRILGQFDDAFEDRISMIDVELGSPRSASGGKSPGKGRMDSPLSPLKTAVGVNDIAEESEEDSEYESESDEGGLVGARSRGFQSHDPLYLGDVSLEEFQGDIKRSDL
ncbi:hypothetical protein SpCBS45565_g04825 [Spizellomyces sp. 'palustris']|nr:hypothetical protein SpCBS45565_g04825 [Spizellomyces sp. 'palustris']